MRNIRFYILVISACLLSSPQTVLACRCVLETPPATFRRSKAVFSGRVLEVNLSGGLEVKFRVEKSWKHVRTEEVVVWAGTGDDDCDYRFEVGESYLVYALGGTSGRKLVTSICTRTRRLKDAGEDLRTLGEGEIPRKGRV